MNGREPVLLVVDDNENNRYTLTRRLKREGYTQIEIAENGRQALQMLTEQSFDLVLLDIMMPEMNGYEVLEHMKAETLLQDIPVIMISATGELDSVVRCIELGAEDYLPKPFNPVLLKARIRASLEKKHLRDDIIEQRDFIRAVFGKYVPKDIAATIVSSRGALKPVQTTATILFTDIEAFTETVEGMSPEQVAQMLNEYFPAVISPITRHNGVVNQFQGDAMLVTFNVPLEDPKHADNALKAALEIQTVVSNYSFAGVSLRTRIGINTGEVFAGNVGSGERVNYTVHGDAVNVAARLEQLNKDYGTRVLVSESTVALLKESYAIEALGDVAIRGKRASIRIFKLV